MESPKKSESLKKPVSPKTTGSGGASASAAYSYFALVFEFLGILAVCPLIGYFVDTRLVSDKGEIGLFFFIGFALGFIYGIIHLYRRAQEVLTMKPPADSGPEMNREGYHKDFDGRIDEIRDGLDDVGKKIDRLD